MEKKLPELPKAEGIDLQYRLKLHGLASAFAEARTHLRGEKKQMCEEAIYNIYFALR